MSKSYLDSAGNEYFVVVAPSGIFRTFKQEPKARLPHRVESRLLPNRPTQARAQTDLDKYAAGCQMRMVVA